MPQKLKQQNFLLVWQEQRLYLIVVDGNQVLLPRKRCQLLQCPQKGGYYCLIEVGITKIESFLSLMSVYI